LPGKKWSPGSTAAACRGLLVLREIERRLAVGVLSVPAYDDPFVDADLPDADACLPMA
jgi:hypothetical protein